MGAKAIRFAWLSPVIFVNEKMDLFALKWRPVCIQLFTCVRLNAHRSPFWAFSILWLSTYCAVLVRRTTHHLFEQSREVLRILESQAIGYLADGMGWVEHTFFGYVNQ